MALGSLRADHRNLVVACRRIVERHPEVGPLWWMGARLLTADDPASLAWELADEIDGDGAARTVGAAVPGEATVVTIGWPEIAGEALMRRPDVTVLCADADHEASSFMQRLERCDVPCEPIPGEWLAHATEAADLVMIDALAAGGDRAIVPVGSRVLATVARSTGTPVWLVAGIGRRLPGEYVDEIVRRTLGAPDDERSLGARIVGREPAIEELPLGVVTDVAGAEGVGPVGPHSLRSDAPFAPELLRSSPI